MALTPLEAYERARQIWGHDQVYAIRPRYITRLLTPGGEWDVMLHNGTLHSIDGNGHPDCHQECAECESQVCS